METDTQKQDRIAYGYKEYLEQRVQLRFIDWKYHTRHCASCGDEFNDNDNALESSYPSFQCLRTGSHCCHGITERLSVLLKLSINSSYQFRDIWRKFCYRLRCPFSMMFEPSLPKRSSHSLLKKSVLLIPTWSSGEHCFNSAPQVFHLQDV